MAARRKGPKPPPFALAPPAPTPPTAPEPPAPPTAWLSRKKAVETLAV